MKQIGSEKPPALLPPTTEMLAITDVMHRSEGDSSGNYNRECLYLTLTTHTIHNKQIIINALQGLRKWKCLSFMTLLFPDHQPNCPTQKVFHFFGPLLLGKKLWSKIMFNFFLNNAEIITSKSLIADIPSYVVEGGVPPTQTHIAEPKESAEGMRFLMSQKCNLSLITLRTLTTTISTFAYRNVNTSNVKFMNGHPIKGRHQC